MSKLHTHYDNLKVSYDAPIGVIKAAYKTLAQAEHPDRSTKPDAHRRMQIINDAYSVLSDPTKRAEHDKWIQRNGKAPEGKSADRSGESEVSKLRRLHRSYVYLIQQQATELAALKATAKVEKWFYVVGGIFVSIPIHIVFKLLTH